MLFVETRHELCRGKNMKNIKKAIRNIILGSLLFAVTIWFGCYMYMSSTFLPNMIVMRKVLYIADLFVAIYAGFMAFYAIEYLVKKAKRRVEKIFRVIAHEVSYFASKIGFWWEDLGSVRIHLPFLSSEYNSFKILNKQYG